MSRRNPRDRRVKMLRLWLRGMRKMSRRIEDAKKVANRTTVPIFVDKDRRVMFSEFSWLRHIVGVRKGTIL